MKFRNFLLGSGCLACLLPLLSAQTAKMQELPAAPSSVQEQQHPKTAPAKPSVPAPPVQNGPKASTQPNSSASTSPPNSAAAPASEADQEEPGTVFRVPVNEVSVIFTVTDKHGHYVKDLAKDDFKVLDNDISEKIGSFQNETDLPLEVGLLIDASNSIRDRFKFEQESAAEFLNQTIRPRYDKAFVVGFDETPEVTQDFTDNTESLGRGIRMLRPGGGTALFDALYFACRDKLLKEQNTGPTRKAIILLSDGEDNQSHVTREEAIDMAERAAVIVYTISTNTSGGGTRGDKILERIAEATGGRTFVPFQITDVANAFEQIQTELRSQYALSYRPTNFRSDGQFHTIEILAENHKGLHVRCKRGYYAPSQ
jgi:VWFA-related protein